MKFDNWKWAFLAFVSWCGLTVFSYAGVKIDLRPNPPVPPGGYLPNTSVHVDTYLVDTGNPTLGDISFRGISLNFRDTDPGLSFSHSGSSWFSWISSPLGASFNSYPETDWVYFGLASNPVLQITLPDNGEVKFGEFEVNVGSKGGYVDLLNSLALNANYIARVEFGFNGATVWTLNNGGLSGGQLELPVADATPGFSSYPANGSIDPRRPNTANYPLFSPTGPWKSIDILLDGNYASQLTASDFVLTQQGGVLSQPEISSVLVVHPNRVRIVFSRTMEPKTWMNVALQNGQFSTRLGCLPGDVNGDGTSSPADILALINLAISENPFLPLWSVDINRDGGLTIQSGNGSAESDLWRLTYLLTGPQAWNGQSLP